jgi:hypothetical protein
MQLYGQLVNLKERARQLKAELLGNDPLRASVLMQGGVQRGTTPAQQFQGELGSFLQAPNPNIGAAFAPDADLGQLGQIQRGLIGRLQLPQAPAFGLAKGGKNIPLAAGKAILVGEGSQGEGLRRGTAEVLVPNEDGTIDVIPLGGMAQGGATLTPEEQLQTGISQAFGPLFASLGFSGGRPMANRANPDAFWQSPMRPGGFHPLSGATTLQRLGIRPNLVSVDGRTYFIDQGSNVGQRIAPDDFLDFGFRPQDVAQLTAESAAALGLNIAPWMGPALAEAPPIVGAPPQTPNRLGLGGLRLQVPGGEMLLPDPAAIANQFRSLDQGTQQLILQGYDMAGLSALNAIERMNFFTPTGTAVQGQTVGLG